MSSKSSAKRSSSQVQDAGLNTLEDFTSFKSQRTRSAANRKALAEEAIKSLPDAQIQKLDKELTVAKEEVKEVKDVPESVANLLRTFDLNPSFGPCMSLTRRERYDRAVKLGLSPPSEIDSLLKQYGTAADTCVLAGRV